MTKEMQSPKRIIMSPSQETDAQIAFLMKEMALTRTNAISFAINKVAREFGYQPKKGK